MKILVCLILLSLLIYKPTATTAKFSAPRHRSPPHSSPPPSLPSPPPPSLPPPTPPSPPPPSLPPPSTPPPSLPPPPPPSLSPPPPPSYNFDHIQFVQSWPPTYCYSKSINCSPNLKTKFYTHGLWPANSTGISLVYCATGVSQTVTGNQLKKRLDRGVKIDLNANWPSIKKKPNNYNFWAHEWNKHGVCSLTTLSLESYFKRGAALSKRLDLLAMLRRSAIVPGPTPYTENSIKNAIQKALRGRITVDIWCSNNSTGTYLEEVYLCLDTFAINFVPCPAKPGGGNCGSSKSPSIQLPPF